MAGFSTVAVIVVGAAVVSADVVVVDVVVSRDVSASIVVEVVVVVAVLARIVALGLLPDSRLGRCAVGAGAADAARAAPLACLVVGLAGQARSAALIGRAQRQVERELAPFEQKRAAAADIVDNGKCSSYLDQNKPSTTKTARTQPDNKKRIILVCKKRSLRAQTSLNSKFGIL